MSHHIAVHPRFFRVRIHHSIGLHRLAYPAYRPHPALLSYPILVSFAQDRIDRRHRVPGCACSGFSGSGVRLWEEEL